MKMNNKKGFTLIELLAVIVILGIIALIATPIVINVIEKARQESYKRSVEFAIDATDYYLLEEKIDEIPSEGIEVTDLKLKNNSFKSGVIKENSKEEVIADKVSNGEYCASGRKNKLTVVKGSCDEIVEPLEIYKVTANSVTSSSITVVVDTNNTNNIKGYYYAINDEIYGEKEETNTKEFTGLTKNTSYKIKVKVEDNEGVTSEEIITVKTTDISAPTYKIAEEGNKVVVTITYPSEKEANWVYEYQQYTSEIGDSWIEVEGTTEEVEFTSNGKLVARVRDKGNENNTVVASEYEVANMAYTDEVLKGSDPVITNGLVPVKIDNEGKVTKANTEEEWYNYEKQEWANAVILTDNAKESDYNDYTKQIPEEKIKAYFVWIPRYKYQIFNDTLYSSSTQIETREEEIQIEFQGKDDIIANGEKTGTWLTHPAFTTLDVSGIWVGKFEVGYNQNSSTSGDITVGSNWTTSGAADTTTYSEELVKKIIVKPNVYSWRNQILHTFFQTFYNFDRNLDSHMMKNTEWGAVAYLSNSKYGKWGNTDYTEGNKEVYKNDSIRYYTGRSIGKPGESGSNQNGTYNWNVAIDREDGTGAAGAGASTTGNITGIYDMSGGSGECMAGYNKNITSDKLTKSGFDKEPITQYSDLANYFDVYENTPTNLESDYSTRKLGDATGELGPFSNYRSSWYIDSAYFINSSAPWFVRGGTSGSVNGAGVFIFERTTGVSNSNYSSRLVLSPENRS